MYYYPFSIDSKGAAGTINPEVFDAKHIRLSFDLSPEANGMIFHNNFNSNVLIDGVQDEGFINTLVFNPEVNWYMYTVMTQNLGKNLKEMGAKEVRIQKPPKDTDIELPYFVSFEGK